MLLLGEPPWLWESWGTNTNIEKGLGVVNFMQYYNSQKIEYAKNLGLFYYDFLHCSLY